MLTGMNTRLLLLAVLAGFSALTAVALWHHGYFGILEPHFRTWGAAQVFADLVILAVLGCLWMVRDAPRHGLRAWPFVLVTLVAGSFGPLLYLAAREWKRP
jgi:uncharacterized membrane protein YqjE